MKAFNWKFAVRAFFVVVGLDAAIIVLGRMTYGVWPDIAWPIVNFPGLALVYIWVSTPPMHADQLAEWEVTLLGIGGGLFSAFVWATVAGYFFRRQHCLKIIITLPFVVFVTYIATFLCCWFLSPTTVTYWKSGKVREVRFLAIDDTWRPALRFMERVCGYSCYQYAGGTVSSEYVYTKVIPSAGLSLPFTNTPSALARQIADADHIVVKYAFSSEHTNFNYEISADRTREIVHAISSAKCDLHSKTRWEWNLQFYKGTNYLATVPLSGDHFLADNDEFGDGTKTLWELSLDIISELVRGLHP
jgi:hypothetical protein